jgi:hypothetical protein
LIVIATKSTWFTKSTFKKNVISFSEKFALCCKETAVKRLPAGAADGRDEVILIVRS